MKYRGERQKEVKIADQQQGKIPLSGLYCFVGTLSQRITSLKQEYAERTDYQIIEQPYESKLTFR